MSKLTRAQFFSQLAVASTEFRNKGNKSPSLPQMRQAFHDQRATIAGDEVAIRLNNSDELQTLCHEAVCAATAAKPSLPGVLTAFEFAWECYDKVTR